MHDDRDIARMHTIVVGKMFFMGDIFFFTGT